MWPPGPLTRLSWRINMQGEAGAQQQMAVNPPWWPKEGGNPGISSLTHPRGGTHLRQDVQSHTSPQQPCQDWCGLVCDCTPVHSSPTRTWPVQMTGEPVCDRLNCPSAPNFAFYLNVHEAGSMHAPSHSRKHVHKKGLNRVALQQSIILGIEHSINYSGD